jgi:hypothetical protein
MAARPVSLSAFVTLLGATVPSTSTDWFSRETLKLVIPGICERTFDTESTQSWHSIVTAYSVCSTGQTTQKPKNWGKRTLKDVILVGELC